MRSWGGAWCGIHGTSCSCSHTRRPTPMKPSSRHLLACGAVVLLGLLAGLQHWLATRRPFSAEWSSARDLQVTTSADRGPGSLREAIFAAHASTQRSRIVVQV